MQSTSGVGKILFLALLAAGAPALVHAQNTRGFDVGLGVGRFVDYESAFSPTSCEQDLGAVSGRVGYRVTSILAIQGSATAGVATGDEQCFLPGIPAPRDGDLFRRAKFSDGFIGTSFFATHVSAQFELLPKNAFSPRLRAGVGRLWDKKIGNWFYGGGVRFLFGRNAIVADVERWSFSYDFRSELLIFRDSGAHELQSFEIFTEKEKPYLIRLGFERRIG